MSETPRQDYLDRLADLLPAKEAARVRADVDAMIRDRVEAELERDPAVGEVAAERRAVAALGPAERLAEELLASPLTIPLTTRQTFVRLLAAVFACHLLLSIALTVVGARSASIPGLLSPLPTEPFASVFLAVIATFLLDAGALLVVFVAVGRARPQTIQHALPLERPATRRSAIEGLILLGLLAVILNLFLDNIFAVKQGEELLPFLANDLTAIIPFANVVLGLFALRHLLILLGRGRSAASSAVDALASLAGSAFFILAATRGKLVQMPAGNKLGREAAEVLDNLIERVFLLVFVVAALLLVIRFVRAAIRFSQRVRH